MFLLADMFFISVYVKQNKYLLILGPLIQIVYDAVILLYITKVCDDIQDTSSKIGASLHAKNYTDHRENHILVSLVNETLHLV